MCTTPGARNSPSDPLWCICCDAVVVLCFVCLFTCLGTIDINELLANSNAVIFFPAKQQTKYSTSTHLDTVGGDMHF